MPRSQAIGVPLELSNFDLYRSARANTSLVASSASGPEPMRYATYAYTLWVRRSGCAKGSGVRRPTL